MLLSVLDRKWREHLYEMDYLQEGIGLRAMAQRDPLVEYKREGFDMFAAMMDGDQGGVGRLPVQPRGRGRGREHGGAEAPVDAASAVGATAAARSRPARRGRSSSTTPRRTAPSGPPARQREGARPRHHRSRSGWCTPPRSSARTRLPCRPARTEQAAPGQQPSPARAATRTRAVGATSASGEPAAPSAEDQPGAAPAAVPHLEPHGDRAHPSPVVTVAHSSATLVGGLARAHRAAPRRASSAGDRARAGASRTRHAGRGPRPDSAVRSVG